MTMMTMGASLNCFLNILQNNRFTDLKMTKMNSKLENGMNSMTTMMMMMTTMTMMTMMTMTIMRQRLATMMMMMMTTTMMTMMMMMMTMMMRKRLVMISLKKRSLLFWKNTLEIPKMEKPPLEAA